MNKRLCLFFPLSLVSISSLFISVFLFVDLIIVDYKSLIVAIWVLLSYNAPQQLSALTIVL